jgi:hypothetical protein
MPMSRRATIEQPPPRVPARDRGPARIGALMPAVLARYQLISPFWSHPMFEKLAKHVEREARADGRCGLAIAASDLYPAMLALIADEDAAPTLADQDSRDHYARLLRHARTKPQAIADAARPFAAAVTWPADRRKERAQILELARCWFTAEVHAAVGSEQAIALHITRDTAPCDNCGGTGKVYAGKQEIDCPVCGGARHVKVESPWRL